MAKSFLPERFFRHGFRHAMGGEDHRRRRWGDLGKIIDEDRTLALQALDDEAVVHDLVAHIDGRPIERKGPLDGVDRPHDAGAKAARRAKKNIEARPFGVGHLRGFRSLRAEW